MNDVVRLLRTKTGEQGTFGVIVAGDFECCSLELPWHDNRNCISCIPTGTYEAQFIVSSTYGPCYWIRGVPGRSEILIHTGNLAGDESEGWKSHSAGCVLIGERRGVLGDQEAVLLSRKTLRRFTDQVMDREDFQLEVQEMY